MEGGLLELKIKSASVMPGVVTAVYLASPNNIGDEIDLEFRGSTPNEVSFNLLSAKFRVAGNHSLFSGPLNTYTLLHGSLPRSRPTCSCLVMIMVLFTS